MKNQLKVGELYVVQLACTKNKKNFVGPGLLIEIKDWSDKHKICHLLIDGKTSWRNTDIFDVIDIDTFIAQ